MMALVGVLCFGSRVASQGLGLSTLKIRSMRKRGSTHGTERTSEGAGDNRQIDAYGILARYESFRKRTEWGG